MRLHLFMFTRQCLVVAFFVLTVCDFYFILIEILKTPANPWLRCDTEEKAGS